jgi:putative RNA 2'-phosphotransferase
MNPKALVHLSKFMSLVLRHRPSKAGVSLDAEGWTSVESLLAGCKRAGFQVTTEELRAVVVGNEKRRFAMSSDGLRIRANQGHSVQVDLGLARRTPPAVLYHGTVERFLKSIAESGLRRGKRHAVHLSPTAETAAGVGRRRGQPVVLAIDAARMHADGYDFFCSENGVWLTEHVPAVYLSHTETERGAPG